MVVVVVVVAVVVAAAVAVAVVAIDLPLNCCLLYDDLEVHENAMVGFE